MFENFFYNCKLLNGSTSDLRNFSRSIVRISCGCWSYISKENDCSIPSVFPIQFFVAFMAKLFSVLPIDVLILDDKIDNIVNFITPLLFEKVDFNSLSSYKLSVKSFLFNFILSINPLNTAQFQINQSQINLAAKTSEYTLNSNFSSYTEPIFKLSTCISSNEWFNLMNDCMDDSKIIFVKELLLFTDLSVLIAVSLFVYDISSVSNLEFVALKENILKLVFYFQRSNSNMSLNDSQKNSYINAFMSCRGIILSRASEIEVIGYFKGLFDSILAVSKKSIFWYHSLQNLLPLIFNDCLSEFPLQRSVLPPSFLTKLLVDFKVLCEELDVSV